MRAAAGWRNAFSRCCCPIFFPISCQYAVGIIAANIALVLWLAPACGMTLNRLKLSLAYFRGCVLARSCNENIWRHSWTSTRGARQWRTNKAFSYIGGISANVKARHPHGSVAVKTV